MMDRRSFFKALGATFVIVAAPLPVKAPAPVLAPVVSAGNWIDFANACAFSFVADLLPEHRDHYRSRALGAARRVIASQQYNNHRYRTWASQL